MIEEIAVGSAVLSQPEEAVPTSSQVPLHAGLAFVVILALVCASFEIDLVEHIDSLSLYMTYSEIARDAGAALLPLLGLAFLWWMSVLLLAVGAGLIPWAKRYRASIVWYIGVSVPLSYFALELLRAASLRMVGKWHPGLARWLLACVAFELVCIVGLARISLPELQGFCRARLAPVGWFHIALVIVTAIGLWVGGVHLFHDYVHPSTVVASSNLPDIYLLTIDALRAEDTSVYGYSRPTTPHLEQFAQRAFTFESFFANSNFTTSGMVSIETGELPWSHRVFHLGGFLRGDARQRNLAELLHQRGYYTAAISSNYLASPVHHNTLLSYDAAECISSTDLSDTWARHTNLIGLNTLYTLNGPLLKHLTNLITRLDSMREERYPTPAETVFDHARDLLERSDIAQPRFVWMHILPPHDPYLAPPPYRGQFLSTSKLTRASDFLGLRNDSLPAGASSAELRARYDEAVLYADHAVGDFLDWLQRSGRLDRSIVIITADHGESFEHQWFLHAGPYLYNGLIHVPLLIHLPGQTQGSHITYPAQQADLLPTILNLVGAQVPNWTDGVSLKPALQGGELPARYVFSMNLESNRWSDPITSGTVAVIDSEFKYVSRVEGGGEGLYRYRTDPDEEHDLIASEAEVTKRMRSVLHNKLKEVNQQFTPKR
jgi:arylsulfatase A-like enzyme